MKKYKIRKTIELYYNEKVSDISVPEIPEYFLKENNSPSLFEEETGTGKRGILLLAASIFLSLIILLNPFFYMSPPRINNSSIRETVLLKNGIYNFIDIYSQIIKKEFN